MCIFHSCEFVRAFEKGFNQRHFLEFPKDISLCFTYLNPQLSGISSFNNTSLRDPLLQYSVIIEKFSISVTIPINFDKFMWSRAL